MAASSNQQSITFACPNKPPRAWIRAALRVIATLILLLGATSDFAQETQPDQHLFLVDISGSMKLNVERLKQSKFKIRKDQLLKWLKQNKKGSVTLKSFDTAVYPGRDNLNLANPADKSRALAWVNQLAIGTAKQTHVWDCLEVALNTATTLAREHSTGSVTLHMLTDGQDTEKKTTKDEKLGLFPDAKEQLPLPKWPRKGDFDVKISSAGAPSPTPSPSPIAASPTPTPTATPTATRSPIVTSPSPTPTATASSTPTATAPILQTPQPTSTPSPTPTLLPQATCPPVTSLSPAAVSPRTVAFEIQEPRVVYSGQFVHFINKTIPRADTYCWTIRRNLPRPEDACETQEQKDADPTTTHSDEHLVHQFMNPAQCSRNYTVLLSATYGTETVAATPLVIVVQASPIPPSIWRKIWDRVSSNVASIPALLTAITTLLGAVNQYRKSRTDNRSGPEQQHPTRIKRFSFWLWVIGFLLAVTILLWISLQATPTENKHAVESSSLEKVAQLQTLSQASVQAAQSPSAGDAKIVRPNINISSGPSDRLANDAATSVASIQAASQNTSIFFVVVVTLLTVVVILAIIRIAARQGNGGRLRNFLHSIAPATMSMGGRSLAEQLEEIERLEKARLLPKDEVRAFHNVILEQVRKRYNISQPELPALPGELKELINNLLTQTGKGVLKWKAKPESGEKEKASNTTADKSPPRQSDKTRSPRLSVTVRPTAERSKETKPSRPRIEIYPTDPGIGIAIFNRNGALIQTIDRHTFNIADMELQIQTLYKIAKDPNLQAKETLHEILETLKGESNSSPPASR